MSFARRSGAQRDGSQATDRWRRSRLRPGVRPVWRLTGAQLCLTQKRPVSIPIGHCQNTRLQEVGRPWRDRAMSGDAVVNEIVRGG